MLTNAPGTGSGQTEGCVVFYENPDERLQLQGPSSFEGHFQRPASCPEAEGSNELRTFTETTLEKRSLINQTLNSISIDPAYLLAAYKNPSPAVNFYPGG